MIIFLALSACAIDDAQIQSTDAALTVPTELLTFLNDPQTSFEVLDSKVGLDSRAARQIIAHRDGPDWQSMTADDNPIDSLEELESIDRVGPGTIWELERWIDTPQDGWVVEGVPFTDCQAELVVEWTNSVEDWEIEELAIQDRAIDTLLAERPYSHILDLAEGHGIGAVALTELRDSAAPELSPVD
jgi:hypothetical protein